VVGEKLCPFAPPVSAPPKLRIRASSAAHTDEVVAEVAEEASLLRAGIDAPAPAVGHTTLLVLDREQMGSDMLGWRDLIALSWRIQQEAIVDAGHAEHLQLVLFHPTATHTTFVDPGAPPDAGDYSIRAPYPTVQLLREVDVQAGVRSYPDAARIPARNRVRVPAPPCPSTSGGSVRGRLGKVSLRQKGKRRETGVMGSEETRGGRGRRRSASRRRVCQALSKVHCRPIARADSRAGPPQTRLRALGVERCAAGLEACYKPANRWR
jgi:hypothetical protein